MVKYSVLLLCIISIFACKSKQDVVKTETEQPTPPPTPTPPIIKEAIFISMERTPCLGKCPSYTITIFNTGKVIYDGKDFAERQGKHQMRLTPDQIKELRNYIIAIKLFEMERKYDKPITDIPSCFLYVNLDGKDKKILDRVDAPAELRNFEKLIEHMVITDRLEKIEKE